MKKPTIIPALVTILLFFFLISFARSDVIDTFDGLEYIVSGDFTIGWDPVPEADYFKLRLYHMDTDQRFNLTENYTGTQYTISESQQIKAGHYVVEICSCNEHGCSSWTESTNPDFATVGGVPKRWRIFWKLAPPSGIIIE